MKCTITRVIEKDTQLTNHAGGPCRWVAAIHLRLKGGEALSVASSEKVPPSLHSTTHTLIMSRTRQPQNPQQATTEAQEPSVSIPTTIRLRAEEAPEATSSSRRIRWSEDVVDNEGMGKKSSKGTTTPRPYIPFSNHHDLTVPVCCIYHKARPVGESSSEESSSSSDSDSDSEDDRRRARMKARRTRDSHPHDHDHEHEHDKDCSNDHEHPKPKKAKRKPSPNAYEKMPKPSKNHDPRRGF